jgi:hypothetical protein
VIFLAIGGVGAFLKATNKMYLSQKVLDFMWYLLTEKIVGALMHSLSIAWHVSMV